MKGRDEEIEELMKIYAVSDDYAYHVIDRICKVYTHYKEPVDQPKLCIIGGPPGAGKSFLQMITHNELQKNSICCNTDYYRKFHPRAKEMLQKHEKFFGDLTNAWGRKCKQGMIDHCLKNGYNIINETILDDAKGAQNAILMGKTHGYEVDIRVLAVHPKISLLGVHFRYEQQKKLQGTARLVPKQYHDNCHLSIPFTLEKIQHSREYNTINIYTREVNLIDLKYSEGLKLKFSNPDIPHRAYSNEIEAPMNKEQKALFQQKCDCVLELMKAREASREEVKEFRQNLGLPFREKRNLSYRR
jgi:hypothetical protein